jgi:hypothetical protein
MALTSWKGKTVRRQDIYIAKNYLTEDELDSLNRMVIIFIETAELQVKDRKDLTVKFWRENVDGIITFNKKALLSGKGSVNNAQMEEAVEKVYDTFNGQRKQYERQQADEQDMQELKMLEKNIKTVKSNNKK